MLTAAEIMIAFLFICPHRNNSTNYGNNNKIKKWEQIKGSRLMEFGIIITL